MDPRGRATDAADSRSGRDAAASVSGCWPGTAATAAICRGAKPTTRITSSCRRSCCSRRRSTACCRSTPSGSRSFRRCTRSPAAPEARSRRRRGIRSATTSGRGGCRRSRASRSRSYGGQLPPDEATLLSFKGIGAYTAGAIRSFAFRAARRDPRHQRRARAVPRLRRRRRSEEPRDEAASVGGVGDARAAAARLRLQSGADGLRRDGLRRAQPEVPRLPDGERAAAPIRSRRRR